MNTIEEIIDKIMSSRDNYEVQYLDETYAYRIDTPQKLLYTFLHELSLVNFEAKTKIEIKFFNSLFEKFEYSSGELESAVSYYSNRGAKIIKRYTEYFFPDIDEVDKVFFANFQKEDASFKILGKKGEVRGIVHPGYEEAAHSAMEILLKKKEKFKKVKGKNTSVEAIVEFTLEIIKILKSDDRKDENYLKNYPSLKEEIKNNIPLVVSLEEYSFLLLKLGLADQVTKVSLPRQSLRSIKDRAIEGNVNPKYGLFHIVDESNFGFYFMLPHSEDLSEAFDIFQKYRDGGRFKHKAKAQTKKLPNSLKQLKNFKQTEENADLEKFILSYVSNRVPVSAREIAHSYNKKGKTDEKKIVETLNLMESRGEIKGSNPVLVAISKFYSSQTLKKVYSSIDYNCPVPANTYFAALNYLAERSIDRNKAAFTLNQAVWLFSNLDKLLNGYEYTENYRGNSEQRLKEDYQILNNLSVKSMLTKMEKSGLIINQGENYVLTDIARKGYYYIDYDFKIQ